jgi:peptidoglycan/xylan/chitin deacetylase (PgdA/CDA1 family)
VRRRFWVIVTLVALALLGISTTAVFAAHERNRGASVQDRATLGAADHLLSVGAMRLSTGSTAMLVPAAQDVLQLPPSLPARAKAMNIPILMYHYVDATPPALGPDANGLTVRTRAFELQMDFLAKKGYHTVTLEQVYDAMAGLASLPTKPVALTFDDGGLDDYTVAYPILRSHHFVATFFVITAFVGEPTTMSWNQLREMQVSGMAIESHTARHSDLTKATAASLRAELTQSREAIEAQLGRAPLALAYPFGHCDQRVIDATRAAGYLIAVTTRQSRRLAPGSVYSWPRVHAGGMESMKSFEASLGVAVTL